MCDIIRIRPHLDQMEVVLPGGRRGPRSQEPQQHPDKEAEEAGPELREPRTLDWCVL